MAVNRLQNRLIAKNESIFPVLFLRSVGSTKVKNTTLTSTWRHGHHILKFFEMCYEHFHCVKLLYLAYLNYILSFNLIYTIFIFLFAMSFIDYLYILYVIKKRSLFLINFSLVFTSQTKIKMIMACFWSRSPKWKP